MHGPGARATRPRWCPIPRDGTCCNAAHGAFQFDDARPEDGLLNLGSGRDVRSSWVNMDAYAPVVDVRHDITKIPWPFVDETFSLVYASHVLEHVPPTIVGGRDALFVIFDEIHRVLKPGGRLVVRVPIGNGPSGRNHPGHYRQFQPVWFRFLEESHVENYYVTQRCDDGRLWCS